MATIMNTLKAALSPAATREARSSFDRNDTEVLRIACDAISHGTKTVEASAVFAELEGVDTPELHLPCLTPTYKQLWIEGALMGERFGAMVYRHDLRDWRCSSDAHRFICSVFIFLQAATGSVACVGGAQLFLRANGALWFLVTLRPRGVSHQPAVLMCLGPLANALCKLHCRNADLVDATPDACPWLEHEQPVRRMSEWKIIRVRPMRRSSPELRSAGSPIVTRLTSRAGHYGDYRSNGLFAKHHGIYWFSETQYGAAELGEVVPEYVVV